MDAETPVPRNVVLFEALFCASLGVDALSAAFTDYAAAGLTDADKFTSAVFILMFLWLVWLAAQRRKRWARTILFGAVVLSALFVVALFQRMGLSGALLIEIVSLALAAAGLYYSFTGDALGWFDGSPRSRRGG
ncbi:MAG: hypothetical protein A4S14_07520 [Proteobacteria bacterium SG_bin9]|nr:MAG: hypothetical protein A4S14_07520 [Proteobacteria bacterium SG_bin9]